METVDLYKNIILYGLIALFASFLMTPLAAKLAKTIGAIDLPANLRSRVDRTKAQRIHKIPKLRLGGLAVIYAFLVVTLFSGQTNPQIIGLLIGASILTIFGFIDDKYELSPKLQLLSHILAAIAAILAGVRFTDISIGDIFINLSGTEFTILQISDFVMKFVFPADLVTILWIIVLINAVNWMCGIDALGENIATITSVALVLIGMKTGNSEVAIVAAILAGSVLGFIPYNFPPSKILGGTVGDVNFGYLLSTLAILSEAKLSTSILLLIIPLADMVYVLIRRIIEHKVMNPLKLLGISGRIHLHHRILNVGFSKKHTLYIEMSIFIILTTIALYFEQIGRTYPYIHIIIISILSLFIISSYIRQFAISRRTVKKVERRAKIVKDLSPEERYKY